MTDAELTKLYYRKTRLFEFLYEICQQNSDVLADTLDNYIASLDEEELCELEDYLVNNFGDNS